MLELAIPFFGSVAISLLLRRLDKNNVNLRRLKTIVERGQRELEDTARLRVEELRDATTRFDMLLVSSDKQLDSMREKLEEARAALLSIEKQRADLREVNEELTGIHSTTSGVRDQVAFIGESLRRIDAEKKHLAHLHEKIRDIDKEAARMVSTFHEAMKKKSDDIALALEARLQEISKLSIRHQEELRDELLERHSELSRNLESGYQKIETDLRNSARELIVSLEDRIASQQKTVDGLEAQSDRIRGAVEHDLPELIRELKEGLTEDLGQQSERIDQLKSLLSDSEKLFRTRLDEFRKELGNQKTLLQQDLISETDRIRDEIRNLDMDALAKKDEILRAAREESARMHREIDNFNETFKNARHTLLKETKTREDEIVHLLHKIEDTGIQIQKRLDDNADSAVVEIASASDKAISQLREKTLSVFQEVYQSFSADTQDMEERLNGFVQKLAGLERSLTDVQTTMVSQWDNRAKNVMAAIADRQDAFEKAAETWDLRISARIDENSEEMHRQKIDSEKNLNELLAKFRDRVEEKEDAFEARIQAAVNQFQEARKALEEKQDKIIENLQREKKTLEGSLRETANQQLSLFGEETDKLLQTIQNNVQQIARAALDSVRSGSERVETDLQKLFESTQDRFSHFQNSHRDVLETILEETRDSGTKLAELKRAMAELRNESMTIHDMRNSAQNARSIAKELSEAIGRVEDKKLALDDIYRKVDELRDLRLKLDAEINMTASKREKVDKIEERLTLIINLKDQIEEKEKNLHQIQNRMEDVLSGYDELEDRRKKVDGLMEDFLAQQSLIEKTISTIQTQEKNSDDLRTGIEKLAELFQKMDRKAGVLSEELETLETKFLSVQKQENEIQLVQQRFLQIEDLLDDIEKKKAQLDSMRLQYERIRQDVSANVQQIEVIERNAESKVRELSEFINAMGQSSSTSTVGIARTVKPINATEQKDVVVRLGRLGWSPEDIADKINLDLATIQTILQTYNH